jgi:hypothetical protein
MNIPRASEPKPEETKIEADFGEEGILNKPKK